jgi:hypothetical protein
LQATQGEPLASPSQAGKSNFFYEKYYFQQYQIFI